MQDGAPAHFSRVAREFLNNNYTNRWIGRRGPIAWPARSPDLNPLDFYLWGHLKTIVYDTPMEVIRNRIIAACEKNTKYSGIVFKSSTIYATSHRGLKRPKSWPKVEKDSDMI